MRHATPIGGEICLGRQPERVIEANSRQRGLGSSTASNFPLKSTELRYQSYLERSGTAL